MRHLLPASLLFAVLLAAACNPAATTENTAAPANTTSTTTNTTVSSTAPPTSSVPPISAAHGGAPVGATGSTEQPEGVDTAALDAKIEKLEAKVKGGSASAADKKTLANTYFERGNIYYNAGSPRLYKFALGDLRRAVKYDATNTEAQAKIDELVRIYNSMGRPVPQNGLEP